MCGLFAASEMVSRDCMPAGQSEIELFSGNAGQETDAEGVWHVKVEKLLQRARGAVAARKRGGTGTYDRIRERAEIAHTCLVRTHWRGDDVVATGRSAACVRQSELIAALGATAQSRIDQAGVGRGGRNRGASRARQIRQGACKAHCPIGGVVRNLCCIECAKRPHRSRLVRRNPRPQQVRDSNRGDDKDNRHHNQQLDQRKTLLSTHLWLPPMRPSMRLRQPQVHPVGWAPSIAFLHHWFQYRFRGAGLAVIWLRHTSPW